MPFIHILTADAMPPRLLSEMQRRWQGLSHGPRAAKAAEIILEPAPGQLGSIRPDAVRDALSSLLDGDRVEGAGFVMYRVGSTAVLPMAKQPATDLSKAPKPTTLVSPAQQRIIQIDITNACQRRCSNCTRFCGHFKRPFFMGVDQFKRAVDSLQTYKGMVGVMGGEPTIHPQFGEMVDYINARRPDPDPGTKIYEPFVSWNEKHADILQCKPWKKGLWTGLGTGFVRHHERIMRSFRYMCVNDHRGGCSHAALLMPRKDLGIPDAEWERYRNACWIQHKWSASITPRGAYFCEVAAALANVFGGPDGWKVEDGWWQRTMKDFGDQLSLCEMCSACLPVPCNIDAEETDLVSPGMLDRLKTIGSAKPVRVVNDTWPELKAKYDYIDCFEPYTKGSDMTRVHDPNGLNVKRLHGVVVCRGYDDYLKLTLPRVIAELDEVTVVTAPSDTATQAVAKECGALLHLAPVLEPPLFRKGAALAECLSLLRKREWVVVLDADIMPPPGWGDRLRALVLNPGALYYVERFGPRLDRMEMARPIAETAAKATKWEAVRETIGSDLFVQSWPMGYCQIFNLGAQALEGKPGLYPAEHDSAEGDDAILCQQWYGKRKCVKIGGFLESVLHLPHGESRTNWKGRISPRLDDDDSWLVLNDRIRWRLSYRAGLAFAGLWQLTREVQPPPGTAVVEIGTMLGDGAAVLSAAYPEHRIITVDPGPTDVCRAEAAKRLAQWPKVEAWKMTSEEAAAKVKADGILVGLVNIDGDHSEPGVRQDIRLWKGLLVSGGHLCGHDYDEVHPGVMAAVDGEIGKPAKVFCDGSWIAKL